MDVGAEPGPEVTRRSAAQVAADEFLAAAQRLIHSYMAVANGYATLTAELAASRREAEELGRRLADAHELIRRLQSAAPAFAELERTMLAELENTERAEVLAAFEAGPKATTRDPFPWSRVKLGLCPGCNQLVYSGQKFNMARVSWSADFAGDVPGERLVFTHRACGDGDHSKDGV